MRRLSLECLEDRRVMAGNVTAAVVNNELRITGDGAANWVEVRQIPGPDGTGRTFTITGNEFNGTYDAEGLPVEGSFKTQINGQSRVTLTVPSDKLRIVLNGGNDVLIVESDFNQTTTARGLVVNTGEHKDYVKLRNVIMNGADAPLSIVTGSAEETGGDRVDLQNVRLPQQALNVLTGGGNDQVFAEFVQMQGTGNFVLGDGSDTFQGFGNIFNTLNINTSGTTPGVPDRDQVIFLDQLGTQFDKSFIDTMNVQLGADNDQLRMSSRVNVTNRLTAHAGAGIDKLLGSRENVNELVVTGFEFE